MKIQERTKKELFNSLLILFSNEEKGIIKTERDIKEYEEKSMSGEFELDLCFEYITAKIHLDAHYQKAASIKDELRKLANIK